MEKEVFLIGEVGITQVEAEWVWQWKGLAPGSMCTYKVQTYEKTGTMERSMHTLMKCNAFLSQLE